MADILHAPVDGEVLKLLQRLRLDSDFELYRWRARRRFRNLLES